MAIERAPNDTRRLEYGFLGPDRWFPDPDRAHAPDAPDMFQWYMGEKKRFSRDVPFDELQGQFPSAKQRERAAERVPGEYVTFPYGNELRTWRRAIIDICDVSDEVDAPKVHSFRDIRNLFGNGEEKQRAKDAVENRMLEALAQRHRIDITDRVPSRTYAGITLEDTRQGERTAMSWEQFKSLSQSALTAANSVTDYLDNPQTGVFNGLNSVLSRRVNEVPGWNRYSDLLLAGFSHKWEPQARYESRRKLVLADTAIEVLLHKQKVDRLKEPVLNILNKHFFDSQKHGPAWQFEFKSLQNPRTYAVEGIEMLEPGDKYEASVLVHQHKRAMRRIRANEFINIDDDTKSVPSTILKMVRKNTLDPSEIEDMYRLQAVVTSGSQVKALRQRLRRAFKKAGYSLHIFQEENSLDGGSYKVEHAGSSKNYQVLRLKLSILPNGDGPSSYPSVPFELSIYTPEAYANKTLRDGMSEEEYIHKRNISHNPTKVDAGVIYYAYPQDIYDVRFESHLRLHEDSIRRRNRARAFEHNPHFERAPHTFTSNELAEATRSIAKRIDSDGAWPHAIVTIGANAEPAHTELAKIFGIPPERQFRFDPTDDNPIDPILIGLDTLGVQVLILDDVGERGRNIRRLKKELPNAKAAVLVLKEKSPAEEIVDYAGFRAGINEYIIFPQELVAVEPLHQSAVGLVTRVNPSSGDTEVLVQKEESGYRLPGGKYQDTDETTLTTLRRELSEELGVRAKNVLSRRLKSHFPLEVSVTLDESKPSSDANIMRLRGYFIDGDGLDISKIKIPKHNKVQSVQWMTIDQAKDYLKASGYQSLLTYYQQWIEDQKKRPLSTHQELYRHSAM